MKRLPKVAVCSLISCFLLFTLFSLPCEAKKDTFELKFTCSIPPMFPTAKIFKTWAKEIESRSKGKVKIALYFAESLVKGNQARKALLKGIADIAWTPTGDDPSAYRLNSVMELPVMGFPNERVATQIKSDIIEKFPKVKAEFKGTEILWQTMMSPQFIHSKMEIRSPDDIKGVKISSFGMNLKILDALGAVAIGTMPMEAYLTVERGVADGSMCHYAAAQAIRVLDLLLYHNEMPLNYGAVHMLMSEKTWKRLPLGLQKIVKEVSYEASEKEFIVGDLLDNNARKRAEKLGHHFVKCTPEEIAEWREKAEPLHSKWIKANEKKGLPARAVYNEVKLLIEKYQ